jgi:hypothetical protein
MQALHLDPRNRVRCVGGRATPAQPSSTNHPTGTNLKPKSLSASAAHVFELCPARYGAESFSRTPNSSNSAADLGSAVHNALEIWCTSGAMKDPDAPFDLLRKTFDVEYDKLFGDDSTRKDEGRDLCRVWYKRTHPIEHEILSAEVKENFGITVTHNGEKVTVPFNYIWDRCDRHDDGEIEVVDYKTIAIPLNAEQMRERIQVRAYGLSALVKYPDAPRIWVTYDMLRHGDPLGVSFTRDECADTYRYLQGLLRRILDANPNDLAETVNDECRWCIRKQVCTALKKHADVGGVHAITDLAEAAKRRSQMDYAAKALKVAIEELDGMLMKHMVDNDILEETFDDVKVIVSGQLRRDVDAAQVKRLVSDDVWQDHGSEKIAMGAFDKLLKDPRLDDDTRIALKRLVRRNPTAPSIKTVPAKKDE